MEQKRRKIKKGKVEKLQNEETTFFCLFCLFLCLVLFWFCFVLLCFFLVFIFFFFFFCFSLFKKTEICFGSTKMGIFYREKAFHAGKKIKKNDFAPSEKYSCYAPACHILKY